MSEINDDVPTIEDSINQSRPKVTVDTTKIAKYFIGVTVPKETVTLAETITAVENTNKNFKFTNSAGGGTSNPAKFNFSQFSAGP